MVMAVAVTPDGRRVVSGRRQHPESMGFGESSESPVHSPGHSNMVMAVAVTRMDDGRSPGRKIIP